MDDFEEDKSICCLGKYFFNTLLYKKISYADILSSCGVDSAEEVYISLVGAGTESEDEFFIDSYSNAITLQDQCAATRSMHL